MDNNDYVTKDMENLFKRRAEIEENNLIKQNEEKGKKRRKNKRM